MRLPEYSHFNFHCVSYASLLLRANVSSFPVLLVVSDRVFWLLMTEHWLRCLEVGGFRVSFIRGLTGSWKSQDSPAYFPAILKASSVSHVVVSEDCGKLQGSHPHRTTYKARRKGTQDKAFVFKNVCQTLELWQLSVSHEGQADLLWVACHGATELTSLEIALSLEIWFCYCFKPFSRWVFCYLQLNSLQLLQFQIIAPA